MSLRVHDGIIGTRNSIYTYCNILVDTCLYAYRNNFISASVDLFNVVPIYITVKIVFYTVF